MPHLGTHYITVLDFPNDLLFYLLPAALYQTYFKFLICATFVLPQKKILFCPLIQMLLPPRNQNWPRTSGKTLTYPGIFPQVPSRGTTNTAASRSAPWEEIHIRWHRPTSSSCFRSQLFGPRKALAKQTSSFTYRITSGTPSKVKQIHSDGTCGKVWIIQHKLANPVPSKCSAVLFRISDMCYEEQLLLQEACFSPGRIKPWEFLVHVSEKSASALGIQVGCRKYLFIKESPCLLLVQFHSLLKTHEQGKCMGREGGRRNFLPFLIS